jgi:hypothetical protein
VYSTRVQLIKGYTVHMRVGLEEMPQSSYHVPKLVSRVVTSHAVLWVSDGHPLSSEWGTAPEKFLRSVLFVTRSHALCWWLAPLECNLDAVSQVPHQPSSLPPCLPPVQPLGCTPCLYEHTHAPCAGEVAPLECNLDALSGISYTKGCYIGQERNSYTHYR